ncbi:MAG: GNAT family N-acetyltransferase [Rhizobiaceae bacterium]|nr:GNAT family N-acetyltransferase [Rhizobiaceae bacterium]
MFFVRTAMEQDLPRVREILVETWHATYDDLYGVDKVTEITNDWHSLEKLENRRHVPNSEFLVADNGEIIGGMAFATQEEKTIHLHQLYVHPDFHGGKTGLHLMIEIENSFIDAEKISLEVEEKNEKAIAFYKKYGFSVRGKTENCGQSGSGIEALIMEKLIVYAED